MQAVYKSVVRVVAQVPGNAATELVAVLAVVAVFFEKVLADGLVVDLRLGRVVNVH